MKAYQTKQHAAKDKPKGFEYYSRRNLLFYNAFVLGFNNRFVWRCPTGEMTRMYARLATAEHCDIGIGTGYFLKRQHARAAFSRLHLVDANAETIKWVRNLFPDVDITSVCADVSRGIPAADRPVRSISLNYLIHCMSGPLCDKEPVLAGLKSVAPAGAAVFGATIVNDDIYQTPLSRRMLRAFNGNGIFDTSADDRAGLEAMLGRHLDDLKTTMRGAVLIFEGRLAG